MEKGNAKPTRAEILSKKILTAAKGFTVKELKDASYIAMSISEKSPVKPT